jgi:arabinose-5-phosphate isomerase
LQAVKTGSQLHEEIGRGVIRLEAAALLKLADVINGDFASVVDELLGCQQRIVVSGIGKSGHIARKIAATLAATGTPAHFVHAGEAAHGDAGMLMRGDVLLVFSNSGDTSELQPLCQHAKRIDCRLIGVSRNPNSMLMRMADLGLILPEMPEACSISLAPTTSATMMLALGDALAVAAMRARGLSGKDIRALHPGGELGQRLRCVADFMYSGDQLPLVHIDAPIQAVIAMISEKRLGMTGVLDAEQRLVGIITDGDLRRRAPDLMIGTAADFMTSVPKTIDQGALVEDALEVMKVHRITMLFVVDESDKSRLVGAVQIYDIAAGQQPAF